MYFIRRPGMRNLLSILVVTTILFFACEGPEGPEGPAGPNGEDGVTVPTINTILANPPVLSAGDSTTVSVSYAYTGTDTLDFQWSAEHGTISGEGSSITWTAPDTVGSYVVSVAITAGENTASGGVSLVVTESDEQIYQWMGMVYDSDENIIDAATVWESETNFSITMPGSGFELFSDQTTGTLTAHKTDYEASTVNGFTTAPDFSLRDFEVEPQDSYMVVVNMSALWEPYSSEMSNTVAYRIQSSMCDSKVEERPRWYEGRFEFTDTIWVIGGEQRIYCVANDLYGAFFGEELVNVTSDTEIDVQLYTSHLTMPVKTFLNMPDVGINKFWVEAWFDSSSQDYYGNRGLIDHGRVSFQWNNYHYHSVRDSIMITDPNIDECHLDLNLYNMNLNANNRNGNYAMKDVKNVRFGTYWVTISIEGEFPVINVVNVDGGNVTFEYDGNSDMYLLEVFEQTATGYNRIWRGVTDQSSITMPALPTGESLLGIGGEYTYRISSTIDPHYSIDDPFTIDMTEWMESKEYTLEVED